MFIKNLPYRIKKVFKETKFVITSVPILYFRILFMELVIVPY